MFERESNPRLGQFSLEYRTLIALEGILSDESSSLNDFAGFRQMWPSPRSLNPAQRSNLIPAPKSLRARNAFVAPNNTTENRYGRSQVSDFKVTMPYKAKPRENRVCNCPHSYYKPLRLS